MVELVLLQLVILTLATVKNPAGAVYSRVSVAAEVRSTAPSLPVVISKSPFNIYDVEVSIP
jgi:hypothetical protein